MRQSLIFGMYEPRNFTIHSNRTNILIFTWADNLNFELKTFKLIFKAANINKEECFMYSIEMHN
jgi:hypothetical protein